MYRRLNRDDRLKIEVLLKQGVSVNQIAFSIGFSVSTVYREVKRGAYTRLTSDYIYVSSYSADIAQNRAIYNSQSKGASLKIGKNRTLSDYIEGMIIEGYSPDVVSGLLKLQGGLTLCTKTLYNYIDKGVFINITNKNLLYKSRRKKKKESKISRHHVDNNTRKIDERPNIFNRTDFGHWEMDTVVGKQGTKSCLLVLTERKTRYEIIEKINGKTQVDVVHALNRIERRYDNFCNIFKTITVDNGSEFLNQSLIEQSCKSKNSLRTTIYYCHAYSSWERGSNENQNAIIKRFIPKGVDIGRYSKNHIKNVENWINTLPRKIHGYLSAYDLFVKELNLL